MEKLSYKVKGMSCASCAASIEKKTSDISGVKTAVVNYATESAKFEVDSPKVQQDLLEAVKGLGFELIVAGSEQDNESADEKDHLKIKKFWFSLIFSIGLFWLAMGPGMHWFETKTNWWIQFILATPIWFGVGLPFARAVWVFITTGHSNMNTLIGLGTGAAYFYSAFITIFYEFAQGLKLEQMVYFEAVGFIISFVYLGQYFEARAKTRARSAMDSLLKLGAKVATLVTNEGEKEIAIEKIEKGDQLRIRPGEKVPVDGVVVSGRSLVDESMMTGEPIPVSKSANDEVFAGTIAQDGQFLMKATKIGSETFLAQIIDFVERAQLSKPDIQRYADRISSYFVPIIVVISILTFAAWFFVGPDPKWAHALSSMIAVLVIACPCALGLATPTAVVVATGKASQKGILISGGDIIEKGSTIDAVIFDKTGTLTFGKPEVVKWKAVDGVEESKLLSDVAALEFYSEHPLSKAILKYIESKGLSWDDPDSFEILAGKGLKGSVGDRELFIGTEELMRELGIEADDIDEHKLVGTKAYVAVNKKLSGYFVLDDQLKPDAARTIQDFKKLGVQTWLISGDSVEVCEKLGRDLGIDHVHGRALPQDKATYLEKLQSQGLKVAMIGDGVNDALALSKADLSIAMGTGSDVAMEASDVTLVKGEISRAFDFFKLSKESMRIIRQNLFLSFIYNIIGIPLAAGLFYPLLGWQLPPVFASIAMGASSISVVSNSLRIRGVLR